MKVPTKCPVCGDPMLNIFPPAEDYSNKVTKTCTKTVNHYLEIEIDGDEVIALSIGIDSSNKKYATWIFSAQKIYIFSRLKEDKSITVLPFFEPNLSNYKKLVDKVKTYLVFS